MNAVGLVSNLLAILSFAWVYRRSVGTPWKTRWLWWLGALILALPGLSFSAHYLRVMPETEVYYEFRSLPGIELCLVPIGVFAGLTATFAHRVFLVVPLLGCLGVGLLPFLKPIFIPIPDEEFTHRCEEGVFLQSTASTCGPAATATLMGNVGIVVSEEQLAREAYSSGRGTEA
ncbi:MAG: hypothetical protein MUF31_17500 [Akkermansiaceae bacterium]|jgi:hypothetical protein|nr:hypothetical protein [Akkermansiaceae bacterium]